MELEGISSKIKIINPPKWHSELVSDSQRASFDHGNSLNYALANTSFLGEYVLILDNDCFPMSQFWMKNIQSLLGAYSAIVAEAPKTYYLTHPCLMILPKKALGSLDFIEGMVKLGFDTGRLIGLQLCNVHIMTSIQLSVREYRGLGITYMNRSFLHLVATSYNRWRIGEFGDLKKFHSLKLDFKYFLIKRWYLDGFQPMTRSNFVWYLVVFCSTRIFNLCQKAFPSSLKF
jgi:hypothetical protein